MNKLKETDLDTYETYVVQHMNTNHLNEDGVAYILKERGITLDVPEEKEEKVQEKSSEHLTLEILRQELDTRNRQFDTLQESYNELASSMEQTNQRLFELNQNQQILMNQLQQTTLLDNLKQYTDKDGTTLLDEVNVDETPEEVTETTPETTEEEPKKGFWARLFKKEDSEKN